MDICQFDKYYEVCYYNGTSKEKGVQMKELFHI